MKLFVDTRQKKGKHLNIERYCSENKITMIPKCLSVGDYMLENGSIAVDTKQSLLELAKDLYSDKKSYNKKYKKCFNENIKLVVLIEEPIKTMKELVGWQSKKTKINGRALIDMMLRLNVSYGVGFKFCDKKETGNVLIGILKGGE